MRILWFSNRAFCQQDISGTGTWPARDEESALFFSAGDGGHVLLSARTGAD